MKKRKPTLTGGPRLSSRGWFVVAVLTYLVLTVGMFADALFAADDTVLSSPGTDHRSSCLEISLEASGNSLD